MDGAWYGNAAAKLTINTFRKKVDAMLIRTSYNVSKRFREMCVYACARQKIAFAMV